MKAETRSPSVHLHIASAARAIIARGRVGFKRESGAGWGLVREKENQGKEEGWYCEV